jgi:hypothetical protein
MLRGESYPGIHPTTARKAGDSLTFTTLQREKNMLVTVGADNRGFAVRDEVIRVVQHLGHHVAQVA